MAKLTLKQQAFIDAYLGEAKGNATKAAKIAKYKGNDVTLQCVGKENLLKPLISAAIAKARELIAEQTGVDQKWVVDRLVSLHDRATQAEPVRDHTGKETGEYNFQGSTAVRSLELLGKNLGMFPNRIEGNVTQRTIHEHRDVSETLGWLREFRGSDTKEETENTGSDRPLLPN